jgi:hypothetical protein
MAAFTLNDIEGLAPTDLPPLLHALDAGERRVAPAVATIGTPEAIAALYSALKAHPQDRRLSFAFKWLGRKSVPTLMAAFDCRDGASNPVGPFVRVPCDLPLLEAIACIRKGRWSARPWRVLPGAPSGSALRPDGSWLVDTNGGTVVLVPDGTLMMAICVRR